MKHKLHTIDKSNPYKVPEGYFEQLTVDIQKRVETKKNRVFPEFQYKWALIPTMVLLLAPSIWVYQDGKTTSKPELLLASVSDEEILNYLDDSELTLDELVSLTSQPLDMFHGSDPNYLQGLDLDNENIDDLINTFDLNDIYL